MPELGVKDAEYLEKYVSLCERFTGRDCSLDTAREELIKLNAEYKDHILGKTLKDSIMGSNLAVDGDGWVPSEICW